MLKTVLITGFGPYANATCNPSWEAVKLIDENKLGDKYGIKLIRREIAVRYEEVDVIVPQMWNKYRPDLTIHVGLSPSATCFVLETQANKYMYDLEDIAGQCPEGYEHVCAGPRTIVTPLDVASICRKFNNDPTQKAHAELSSDAGRYLCDYIYYTSLYLGRSPTLFVHVPLLETYKTKQLAEGLERILEYCLKQITVKSIKRSC